MTTGGKKKVGVIGVDEAGRGSWAGPVVAAAVWTMDESTRELLKKEGVTDSKQISEKERERLYDKVIKPNPNIKYAVGLRSASDIDDVNILQATLASMDDAVDDVLFCLPDHDAGLQALRVDGKILPPKAKKMKCAKAIVGGDGSDVTIGAASIVAKVYRDRLMARIHQHYPQYGFAQHKGYGVKKHLQALQNLGPIPQVHRLSYKPLQNLTKNS